MRTVNRLQTALIAVIAVFALSAPASAAFMDSWGGDITKMSLTYYTFDGAGNVMANSVSLSKPKGVETPNTLITTTYPDGPEPLVSMSITADVNGTFFLRTEGELIADSRGASGHSIGDGVLLLDGGLTFNPATEEFAGSGDMIYFDAAVTIAASSRSKNGIDSGAARLLLGFARAKIVTVTDGVPDFDNEVTTKLVLKSLSTRFTQESREQDTFDYTPYDGEWDYVFTITNASYAASDLGVPQAGTLTLNVDSEGHADFDVGNSCSSTYNGWMRGRLLALYSGNESLEASCMGSATIMVTFTDSSNGSGTVFIIDNATGQWITGTLTLSRV